MSGLILGLRPLLQSNAVSYWLVANQESALHVIRLPIFLGVASFKGKSSDFQKQVKQLWYIKVHRSIQNRNQQ